jgi:bifunctional non-homologous end joining protein LigD
MTKHPNHRVRPVARRRRETPTSDRRIKTAIGKTNGSGPTVVGIQISHPNRLIYPDLGISKIQFAQYYERIAE